MKFNELPLWRGSDTLTFRKQEVVIEGHNFLVEFANDYRGILDVLPPVWPREVWPGCRISLTDFYY